MSSARGNQVTLLNSYLLIKCIILQTMMVTDLWTSNINVACKPLTHIFEDKFWQKMWGK
jgi:hypothetical protein